MRQRKRRQHHRFASAKLTEPAEPDIPVAGVQEIAIGQDATLGLARRAGGVEDGCLRLGPQRGNLSFGTERCRRLVRPGHGEAGPDRRSGSLQVGNPLTHRNRCRHLAMTDQVLQFRSAQIRIDRDDRRPDSVQRQEIEKEVGAVEQQETDTHPRTVSGSTKLGRPRTDLRLDGGVTQIAGADPIDLGGFRQHPQKGLVWVAARGCLETRGDRFSLDGHGQLYMNSWMLPCGASKFSRSTRFSLIFKSPSISTSSWVAQPA